jgi:hypothetical protein
MLLLSVAQVRPIQVDLRGTVSGYNPELERVKARN